MKNLVGTLGQEGCRYVVEPIAYRIDAGPAVEIPGRLRFPGTRLLSSSELVGSNALLSGRLPAARSRLDLWGTGIFEVMNLAQVRVMTLEGFQKVVQSPVPPAATPFRAARDRLQAAA